MGSGKDKRSKSEKSREIAAVIDHYRIADGKGFHLKEVGTTAPPSFSKADSQKIVEHNLEKLNDLQEKLYAQDQWAVLLVFQGMDAAGKDSAIEHVMSGINPQGCQVFSFKASSPKELDHDYLWRCAQDLPERGRIGIFNRSYYEEVLVVRVHPEFLAKQRIPKPLVTKNIWQERFEDINGFERYLSRNGILILKFFLNVSKEEQRQRFLERLEIPAKRWKFSMGDVGERALWPKYMAAYQDLIRHTSSAHAPWHVVPADNKWFARAIIGTTIVKAMEKLNLQFPKVDPKSQDELAAVAKALTAEKGRAGNVKGLGKPAAQSSQKSSKASKKG